jgi:hypothetical protein
VEPDTDPPRVIPYPDGDAHDSANGLAANYPVAAPSEEARPR